MFWMIATFDSAFAGDAMTRDEMGTKIVSALAEGMGMQGGMGMKLAEMTPPGLPEDWKPLWKQAALDELSNDSDAIYAIKGKALATKLTEAQLDVVRARLHAAQRRFRIAAFGITSAQIERCFIDIDHDAETPVVAGRARGDLEGRHQGFQVFIPSEEEIEDKVLFGALAPNASPPVLRPDLAWP